ncbi:MAG: hypothetical protein J7M10_07830, partial [Candidatus Cloacimonetes bacterium]|nr:hypothetical protein [Candidatus Cloacimonadota bacterium]
LHNYTEDVDDFAWSKFGDLQKVVSGVICDLENNPFSEVINEPFTTALELLIDNSESIYVDLELLQ